MTTLPHQAPPSVNGTIIMVMSCGSFLCCGIFLSVPAMIMANSAKSQIASWEAMTGNTHPEGGTVKAAFWVAVANAILSLLLFIVYFLLFTLGVAAGA